MQLQHQILQIQYLLAFNLLILLKFKNTFKILILKKLKGFDKIPPKLGKHSTEILSTPSSIAMNNNLKYGAFRDDAKIASVIPLNKV